MDLCRETRTDKKTYPLAGICLASGRGDSAKQSQFPFFWLKNAGSLEKQSQLGRTRGAKRRAGVPAGLNVSCEYARPTQTDPGNTKQSQFPRFWPKNAGSPIKQSQFHPQMAACRGGNQFAETDHVGRFRPSIAANGSTRRPGGGMLLRYEQRQSAYRPSCQEANQTRS